MISTLHYKFSTPAERERARARFLRDFLDAAQKIRAIFADQGMDDPFLALMMLHTVWADFIRYERGYPRLDDDMKPNVVGPVIEVLKAFDDVISKNGNLLRDFDKALTECESKIGKSVGDGVSA